MKNKENKPKHVQNQIHCFLKENMCFFLQRQYEKDRKMNMENKTLTEENKRSICCTDDNCCCSSEACCCVDNENYCDDDCCCQQDLIHIKRN